MPLTCQHDAVFSALAQDGDALDDRDAWVSREKKTQAPCRDFSRAGRSRLLELDDTPRHVHGEIPCRDEVVSNRVSLTLSVQHNLSSSTVTQSQSLCKPPCHCCTIPLSHSTFSLSHCNTLALCVEGCSAAHGGSIHSPATRSVLMWRECEFHREKLCPNQRFEMVTTVVRTSACSICATGIFVPSVSRVDVMPATSASL